MRWLGVPSTMWLPCCSSNSSPSEGLDRVAAGNHGQFHRPETSTTSSIMQGDNGSPRFRRLFGKPPIASRTFSIASTRIRPWETHPGRTRQVATSAPSSPGILPARRGVASPAGVRISRWDALEFAALRMRPADKEK